MELVEGPTLADRIAQGPIPVDEALSIAKHIAEALEPSTSKAAGSPKVQPDHTPPAFQAAFGNATCHT